MVEFKSVKEWLSYLRHLAEWYNIVDGASPWGTFDDLHNEKEISKPT